MKRSTLFGLIALLICFARGVFAQCDPDWGSYPYAGGCFYWDYTYCYWSNSYTCDPGYTYDSANCSCVLDCSSPTYSSPGCGYYWDSGSCEWLQNPYTGCSAGYVYDSNCNCVVDCSSPTYDSPGCGYAWDPSSCEWVYSPPNCDPATQYADFNCVCQYNCPDPSGGFPPACETWNFATCQFEGPSQECSPGYIWDVSQCGCVAVCPNPTSDQPGACYSWDIVSCSWLSLVTSCPSGYQWDDGSCSCLSCAGPIGNPPCSNSVWDPDSCSWGPPTCPAGQTWDLSMCGCYVEVYLNTDPAIVRGSSNSAHGFHISRGTADPSNDLTVYYTIGGTAVPDVDYPALSGSAVIPAGQAEVLIPIQGVAHGNGPATIEMTITPDPSYAFSPYTGHSGVVTLYDPMAVPEQNHLRLWLRSDDGVQLDQNGAVAFWLDQSAHGNHAVAIQPGCGPTLISKTSGSLSAQNHSFVHFDGVSQAMALPGLSEPLMSGATEGQIFIVQRAANLSGNGFHQFGGSASPNQYPNSGGQISDDFGSATQRTTSTGLPWLGSFHLYSALSSAGQWQSKIDEFSLVSAASNSVLFSTSPTLGAHYSGTNYSGFFKGDVAEILVYDHILTAGEAIQLQEYVTAKYADVSLMSQFKALGNTDSTGEGIPDWWKVQYGFDPLATGIASLDSDGDGISNYDEYLQGSSPFDYYNGVPPTLTSVSGDGQTVNPSSPFLVPLIVQVSKGGSPLSNAPIVFAVDPSMGQFVDNSGQGIGSALSLVTDASGNVSVKLIATVQTGTFNVTATAVSEAGATQVTFTEQTLPLTPVLSWASPVPLTGFADSLAIATAQLTSNGIPLPNYQIQFSVDGQSSLAPAGTSTETGSDGMLSTYVHITPDPTEVNTLTAAASGATSIDCQVLPYSLLGLWQFDETTEQIAQNPYVVLNSTPDGPDGEMTPDVDRVAGLTAATGGAVAFNGSTGGIAVPNYSALAIGTGEVTLSAWVELAASASLSADTDIYPILAKGNVGGPSYVLALKGGSARGLSLKISGPPGVGQIIQEVTVDPAAQNVPAFTDGLPHLVVATRDASGHVALSVDGIVVGSQGGVALSLTNTSGLFIGWDGDQQHFNGSLDQVQILGAAVPLNSTADDDGDGVPDWYEQLAGIAPNPHPARLPSGGNVFTPPTAPNPNPIGISQTAGPKADLTHIPANSDNPHPPTLDYAWSGGQFELIWDTAQSFAVQIVYQWKVGAGDWQNLQTNTFSGKGQKSGSYVAPAPNAASVFYRIIATFKGGLALASAPIQFNSGPEQHIHYTTVFDSEFEDPDASGDLGDAAVRVLAGLNAATTDLTDYPYGSVLQDAFYGGPYGSYPWYLAGLAYDGGLVPNSTTIEHTHAQGNSATYWLTVTNRTQGNVEWAEVFYPDAAALSDDPPPPVVRQLRSVSVADASPTPTYPLTPQASDIGVFGLSFPMRVLSKATVSDPQSPTKLRTVNDLSDDDRISGKALLRAPDGPGDPGVTGSISFFIPTPGKQALPGEHFTVTWTHPQDFQVTFSAAGVAPHTVDPGFEVDDQTFADDGVTRIVDAQDYNPPTWTILPKSTAGDGESCVITVTSSYDGTTIGTDSVTYVCRPQLNRPYTIAASESSGTRFRKIALNGRPLPDERPEDTEETDQAKEENYIDALTLGLHSATTDVYVPIPGSDLALTVRRETTPEVWSAFNGLRPHERWDRPFGAGWTSNLSACLERVTQTNGAIYLYVTDLNGASSRFVQYRDENDVLRYFPLPSDTRENGNYLVKLDWPDTGVVTFTDRYGTKILFDLQASPGESTVYSNRETEGSVSEQHQYWRVKSVVDRYNNTLNYHYANATQVTTLVPDWIAVGSSLTQRLTIQQDESGRVMAVWDPNGNKIVYDYTTLSQYTHNGSLVNYSLDGVTPQNSPKETVLSRVEAPVPPGQTSSVDTNTLFTYDFALEDDLTPAADIATARDNKYHLEVGSITRGTETYSFEYTFDTSKYDLDIPFGTGGTGALTGTYYQETGLPRNVTKVHLPDGVSTTILANESKTKIEYRARRDGTGYGWFLTDDSARKTTVTDAGTLGGGVTYIFDDEPPPGGALERQYVLVTPVTGYLEDNQPPPQIICYLNMKMETGGGNELFTFDQTAGLALKSVRDFSGNTTSYQYGDAVTPPASQTTYNHVFPEHALWGFYPDPTIVTDALGQTKANGYDDAHYHILNRTTDEGGVSTTYTLDNLGRRTNETITGRITDYEYTNAGFPGAVTKKTVRKMTDAAWSKDFVTTYDLDGNGRVATQIMGGDDLSLMSQFTYDNNGNKLSSEDQDTQTTYFQYDARNRLVETIYPDGSAKQVDYDIYGNKWHVTDENGNTTTFAYDVFHRVTDQAQQVTIAGGQTTLHTQTSYDDPVQPKNKVIDSGGHVTDYTYDSLLRLTQTARRSTAGDLTTQLFYDGANCGSQAFDSAGFKPSRMVDARGFETKVYYDVLYRPHVKLTQYEGTNFAQTVTNFDAVGNPHVVITPATPVVGDNPAVPDAVTEQNPPTRTTNFDALRRPTQVIYATGDSTSSYYTPTSQVWKTIDEMGQATETQYDSVGRAVLVLSPEVDDGVDPTNLDRSAHQQRPQTSMTYDGVGNVLTKTDPRGNVWTYEYDVRNRKTKEIAPGTDESSAAFDREWGYDYAGNVLWVQDERGYTTETQYDELNRAVLVIAPPVMMKQAAGRPTTHTVYDAAGNIVQVIDGNEHTVTNGYDDFNRLITSEDGAGITVTYGYDPGGNRTLIQDGLSQQNAITYDGFNRVKTILGTTYTYDALNKLTRLDANSQQTHYAYDLRQRLLQTTYPGSTQPGRTYTLDAVGRILTVTESAPAITPAANENVVNNYDAMGRLLTEQSSGVIHRYVYDPAGNRVFVQYGNGFGTNGQQIVSSYDAKNRLQRMEDGGRVTYYNYDPAGNVSGKLLPNGERETIGHDALNRTDASQDSGLNGTLYTYHWFYDGVGNLTESQDETPGVPSRTVSLSYDGANRLQEELATDSQGAQLSDTVYTYDAAYNRTGKQERVSNHNITYAYNNKNQLTGWTSDTGSGSYGYDSDGNRTSRSVDGTSDTYTYDAERRLVGVTRSVGGATTDYSYAYDYRTRRLLKVEDGEATSVVFSGGLSVQEYQAGNLVVENVRGSDWGGGVGGILYSLRPGTDELSAVASFAHYNNRGDVTTRTDESGAITYQASYEAGGTRAAEWGSTLECQKANTKEEDPTGLLNEGMRYRDLETDTFLTRDPADFIDGPNLYSYVQQNPWSKFDPEGLAEESLGSTLANRNALIDELSGRASESTIQRREAGRQLAGTVATAAEVAVSLHPAGNASEALTGKDATGEKIGWFGRVVAIGGVVAGPAEKLAGKLLKGAKEALTIEKTASATVKETAQIVKNAEQGKVAEELVGKQLADEGKNVVGSRVTVNTPEGRRVLDHLVDAEGNLTNVEVKSGNATRNASQIAKDKAMATEGGTVVGKNAPAELRGKTVNIQTEVRQVP